MNIKIYAPIVKSALCKVSLVSFDCSVIVRIDFCNSACMQKQQYDNHKKYYPPHHFIFLPVMSFFTIYAGVNYFQDADHKLLWLLFGLLSLSILYLAVMLRQHYALGNQNRIVRLEFRLRYYQAFSTNPGAVEEKLSFAQIAALRFAGDDEFKELLQRVLANNMEADEIKKNIRNWKADNMRV